MKNSMLLAAILTFACFLSLTKAFDLNNYAAYIKEIESNPTFKKDFETNIKDLLEIEPNYFNFNSNLTFQCDVETSPQIPTSVHKLRPSDIKVIAALGDSLTAALGSDASTILGLLFEYRGRSWSMGGQDYLEKLVTLPNILKKFNPNLTGFSTEKDFALFNENGLGLNAAVSGQEANHLPNQARTLIKRLKAATNFDWKNDWKMITVFIGGNDVCAYCDDEKKHSPEAYLNDIQKALDILFDELPRTFVNLVTVLDVSQVDQLNKGLVCNLLHRYACKCAAFPGNDAAKQKIENVVKQYQNFTENLAISGEYDTREDFTVVAQPFLKEMKLPRLSNGKVDFSYFAPDCFHFSTKGHSASAVGIWNNLLEPVGKKDTEWQKNEAIICPTKSNPYFFTNKNSV